jgi:hypothetical protein
MCAALFDVSDGPEVELSFEIQGDRVHVEGRTASGPTASLDSGRFALSEQILRVACDGYSVKVNGEHTRFSLHKLR